MTTSQSLARAPTIAVKTELPPQITGPSPARPPEELKSVVERLRGCRRLQAFRLPVTDAEAPGYSSTVTSPIDFQTIDQRIDSGVSLYPLPLPLCRSNEVLNTRDCFCLLFNRLSKQRASYTQHFRCAHRTAFCITNRQRVITLMHRHWMYWRVLSWLDCILKRHRISNCWNRVVSRSSFLSSHRIHQKRPGNL